MSSKKSFGVIVCDSQAKWGGPEGIAKRLEELLATENSEWKTFVAERGEFPTEDELKTFQGIYITGSKHSVNDDDTQAWIKGLELFIQRAYDLKKPRVFGTCFGHQAIAKALGGTVAQNPTKRIICHNEEIKLCENDSDSSFFKDLKKINEGKPFRILQAHSQCVEKLPKNATNVATSDSCKHEIVLYSDNIIGSQSHADFTLEDLTEVILPSHLKKNAITQEEFDYAKQSFQQPNACLDMAKAIREFLNS